jgi:hypothetical protein
MAYLRLLRLKFGIYLDRWQGQEELVVPKELKEGITLETFETQDATDTDVSE